MLLKTVPAHTQETAQNHGQMGKFLTKGSEGTWKWIFFSQSGSSNWQFTLQKSNFAPWSRALQQRWWNSWNPWNECKPGPGRDVKPESHQAGEKAGVQFILWIYHSCEQEGTRETIHYAASAFLASGSQISAFSAGVRLGPWNLHPQRNSWHLNQSLRLPQFLSPKNNAALTFTGKLLYLIISVVIVIPDISALLYNAAGAGLLNPPCVIPSALHPQHPTGPLHTGIQLRHWKELLVALCPDRHSNSCPQLTRLRKQNEIWEQPSFSID